MFFVCLSLKKLSEFIVYHIIHTRVSYEKKKRLSSHSYLNTMKKAILIIVQNFYNFELQFQFPANPLIHTSAVHNMI